ncbi:proton-conducting transporter transmembrane domain-containing protein [Halalkalicoccus jeotgali]|uniref:Monovalent cation/H+ antiporter subunit D n=1 Tax=Halalkalicoccus jeotgali (strain DSM 18796 / CECT 7217 / JCM 14584 / KCTC 4019 / B3) TaxID=795797 RepID=D8J660_HALJB|nr:proton-conducting transporter membrane subunit [Halalkalicoccus jeotgali]ADJ15778.1 putative monovalent cation/H+ antiporter subunit D [Halalkalicoccus jeotgali B3]ELY37198.1 monovalent cation/H+ antiporter subunit D [Halalkalicoccus jeotgali B3]
MVDVASIRPLAAVLVSFLAAGAIVASYRHPNIRDSWSVLAALAKFGIVASMLPGVLSGTVYVWSFGTFLPGVEFALRADPLGLFFALLASFLWIFTAFYATGYMRGLDEPNQTRFFAAFAVSLSTAVGIAFAQNLVTIFVFYELLSVATYPLVAHDEDAEARIAGRKYLAYTFFGGGVFVLAGTVLVFQMAGTVDFVAGGIPALAQAAGTDPWFARLAFGLLVTGFGVKAALMPIHSWLADAMVAPTPVSGLLHAVAVVKSGAFGISRVVLDVYGPDLAADLGVHIPLAIVAAFTLTAASIIALRKDHLKRRLAYSTTAQLSYIVLGLSMLHPYAILGGLFHIPAHAFCKLTLFFCAGSIHVETHTDYISEMAGIGKRMPFTMAAFTVGAAGMAGIPLVAGFVSKYYMLIGGLGAGGIGVIGAEGATMSPLLGTIFSGSLILSGLLNIAYFWPIVYTAYFESENRHDAKPLVEFPMGGKPESYGVSVGRLTDGGKRIEDPEHEDGYAVDQFPSDHTDDPGYEPDDHDDHHGGGPPDEGWERRTPWTESTWLMLAPIGVIATGAIVLGVVPAQAVFFDLAGYIVETVTGVVVP